MRGFLLEVLGLLLLAQASAGARIGADSTKKWAGASDPQVKLAQQQPYSFGGFTPFAGVTPQQSGAMSFNGLPAWAEELRKDLEAKQSEHNATVKTHDWQNGECQHCGKPFTRQVKWQKFCGESCRVASWENRTGAKVKRKAKPTKA